MKQNDGNDSNSNEANKAVNRAKVFISNKMSEIEKPPRKSTGLAQIVNNKNETVRLVKKNSLIETESQLKENLNLYFKGKRDPSELSEIVFSFLKQKFIPAVNSDRANKNFYNQLIQIRPPEGINAVVASPLIDSNKGWAPSIPSTQINHMKTNLTDLMMRAKGGIKDGDIPKEAHMAFYLGIMNEEEKRYEEALKFYKKYFLSAKLLQDIYGTELALNRIAVLYSNLYDFQQSLYYNEKHKEITTHNINGIVAYYNSGVCQRILGKIDESIQSFNKALQMAEEENVLIYIN